MNIRICENCKQNFTIAPEDFEFYKRLDVPPPTFCPECRMIRRMTFRNERALYKNECALCKKNVMSMYGKEKPVVVYCLDCYQTEDKWDPSAYGVDYDFSKTFFEQFSSLLKKVPRRALYQDFATHSDYSNWAVYLKNSYLIFGGHHYEDTLYASSCFYINDCCDLDFCKKCEACSNSIHIRDCHNVHWSAYTENCTDSSFLYGCKNCHDCIGCTNLKNSAFCILNTQYTKDEYTDKVKELQLDSHEGLEKMKKEAANLSLQFPRKFAWVRNAPNSTGDDLEGVKDCIHCFTASEDENCRYAFFLPTGAKDSYDLDHVGLGAENVYEVMSAFGINRVVGGSRIYFSHDIYYSDDCYNSSNLFGCIGLRKKEYCILNKQYSKDEYEKLFPKIKEHMMSTPYRDKKGRTYGFGEFFPTEISPFCYNETTAEEYFTLTENEAVNKGYAWKREETKKYEVTREPKDIPNIQEVTDDITKQIIRCEHGGLCNDGCTTAFRIIPQELEFYKKVHLPLPKMCPNCRHYERLGRKNPITLYDRNCDCINGTSKNSVYKNLATHVHNENTCGAEFKTPYAPTRPEIIYCEQCYQSEVA